MGSQNRRPSHATPQIPAVPCRHRCRRRSLPASRLRRAAQNEDHPHPRLQSSQSFLQINQIFNQSDIVVTIETDAGITGIGEGGSKDLLAPCAGRLIGRDPQFIEHLWQDMNRSYFYPAGRERTDAIGALDLALWDIRGKALNAPVHQLLGGMVRNYCECYNTAGIIPGVTRGMAIKDRARLTIAAGYRAFRFGAMAVPANTIYNTRERITTCTMTAPPARRRRQRRRMGHRLPSALRSRRSHPRLRPDRGPRALLRRRPRPH